MSIIDLESIFSTEFAGMYVTHFRCKFLMPNSSCPLIVTIEPKTEFSCRRHFVILQ
jgi:hypothetical protein